MASKTISGYTRQRFSVYRRAGGVYSDTSLKPLYENVACRFVEYGQMTYDRTQEVELVIGKAQVWTEHELPGVRKGDIVVLQNSDEYVILTIERRRDITGKFDHTKLILA